MSEQIIPLQSLFDQDAGTALAKQFAFAEALPCRFDECEIFEQDEGAYIGIAGIEEIFPVELLGIENHDTHIWTHGWAAKEFPRHTYGMGSQDFCLQFRTHELFETAELTLEACNGDFFGVIASDVMDASAYFVTALDEHRLAFWLAFDLPFDASAALSAKRYQTIARLLQMSSQVEDTFCAMRYLLFSSGFEQGETTEDDESIVESWSNDEEQAVVLQGLKTWVDDREHLEVSVSAADDDDESVDDGDSELADFNREAIVRFPLMRHLELGAFIKK